MYGVSGERPWSTYSHTHSSFIGRKFRESTAIKIKVEANKLCGKVSDNKKVKSFFPLFLSSPLSLSLLSSQSAECYYAFNIITRLIKFLLCRTRESQGWLLLLFSFAEFVLRNLKIISRMCLTPCGAEKWRSRFNKKEGKEILKYKQRK